MSEAKAQKIATRPAVKLEPMAELLLVRELEKFVNYESELLDDREFETWCALYTEDAIYWAPSRVDQTDPLNELSLIYDDREIRDMRIRRLRHPRVHAQIPYSRTTHLVGNFVVEDIDQGGKEIAFRCRFAVHEYRPEWDVRTFAGQFEYRVARDGASFRIKYKKATIINCDAMHYPISIPF